MKKWQIALLAIGATLAISSGSKPGTRRRMRRIHHAVRCWRHGIMAPDLKECPKCGRQTKPIELVSARRARRGPIERRNAIQNPEDHEQ
jgi:ribosomal protein L32